MDKAAQRWWSLLYPDITNLKYTVKHRFIFVPGPKKEWWIREIDRCGGLYKIRFVQGSQKLNDGTWKMIHLETIDRGFTVYKNASHVIIASFHSQGDYD